jgi:hypothetical protein
MSKRLKRTSIGAQFSARRIDMLESPAYRVLSLSARKVIDRIDIEHMRHGGAENGRLPVTFKDFREYGIHYEGIAPAIREAEALGFIEITRRGRAGNAEFRQPNLFRLTFHRSAGDYGDGTHEWQKIGEDEAELLASAARKSVSGKSKVQYGKTDIVGTENPHQNGEIHTTEPPTTGQTTETPTTIYISGREDAA